MKLHSFLPMAGLVLMMAGLTGKTLAQGMSSVIPTATPTAIATPNSSYPGTVIPGTNPGRTHRHKHGCVGPNGWPIPCPTPVAKAAPTATPYVNGAGLIHH